MSVEHKVEKIAALHAVGSSAIERALRSARDALLAKQDDSGHWLFELEADCTIPAEYILMMHFLDEIDVTLESKLAAFLRERQAEHGGWPLYHGGSFDISCSVKAYYALKLAGDDPQAPHMARARSTILQHGGAARANVFTRITLAMFGQVPWRGVPYIPVEIMLLPKWFPFHLDKVSYWSRTVMVPLFVLCTHRAVAKNPRAVDIRELFTVPPELERNYFRRGGFTNRLFLLLDRLGRRSDPLVPRWHARAGHRACRAVDQCPGQRRGRAGRDLSGDGQCARGDGDCSAIRPMIRAASLAKRALHKLLVVGERTAYCQPCVSPVWDTALSCLALRRRAARSAATRLRAGSSGCGRCSCWKLTATGSSGDPTCPGAAGHFSSTTAITPIWTIPRRSPGRCTLRRSRSGTRARSRARSTGWSACRAKTAALPRSMSMTPTTT